jgi:hypothetical protein
MYGLEREPSDHLSCYCRQYFGTADVAPLYDNFYSAYVTRSEPELREMGSVWCDGALYLLCVTLTELLEQPNLNQAAYEAAFKTVAYRLQIMVEGCNNIRELDDRESPRDFRFANWPDLAAYLVPMLDKSHQRWSHLRGQIETVREGLPRGFRFYDENLRWQSLLVHTLTQAALEMIAAVSYAWKSKRRSCADRLKQTVALLDDAILQRRQLAEHAHFRGWFEGETLLSLTALRDGAFKLCSSYARPAVLPDPDIMSSTHYQPGRLPRERFPVV